MKILLTRKNADGTYPSVGMSSDDGHVGRMIRTCRSRQGAKRIAQNFTRGRTVRVEILGDNVYGDSLSTFEVNAG